MLLLAVDLPLFFPILDHLRMVMVTMLAVKLMSKIHLAPLLAVVP